MSDLFVPSFSSLVSIKECSEDDPENFLSSHQTESSLTIKASKRSSVEVFSKTEQFNTLKRKMNTMLWESVSKNDQDSVSKLLDPEKYSVFRADTNAKGLNKWTALHIASAYGYKRMCKILLKIAPETKLNAKTSIKRTPLHLATFHNNLSVVKFLIRSGADISIQDSEKNTALHLASMQGNKEIIDWILKNSPVFSKNSLNRTAFCLSVDYETHQTFVEYFHSKNIEISNTAYSRNLIENTVLRNSREDHIGRILAKCSMSPNLNQLKAFNERPKFQAKKPVKKLVLPYCKVGPSDFKGIALLGKGSFGEVYLVEKIDTNEKFALKVLKKEKIFSNHILKYAFTERNILLHISHPFIVKLHFSFQTPENLIMVMDFCPCGDLSLYLSREKTFSESKAKFYICEIVLALGELHKHGIIFRDLKPENVVVDQEGHIKLTDFGLSKENASDEQLSKSFCGSLAYLAPEMLRRAGHTRSVDWYLLGVILFEMVCGSPPFYSPNREEMFKNIQRTELVLPQGLSIACKSIIRDLMNKDVNRRLGAGKRDFEEVKEHFFFDGVNWDAVMGKKVEAPGFREVKRSGKGVAAERMFGKMENEVSNKLDGWSVLQPSKN